MPAHELLQPIDLTLPDLPEALEGLRIAHISDLHVHRPARRWERLIELAGATECDLALFTGDYMTYTRHEQAAVDVLARVADAVRPQYGRYGVFGNHDSATLKRLVQEADLPIRWLSNAGYAHPELPLDLLGVDTTKARDSDPFRALLDILRSDQDGLSSAAPPAKSRLRILLSHIPNLLPIASDLGVDLMLSGHTHGGQMRLPGVGPLYNSTDLPLTYTAGLLRYGQTLCCVTRGLGEVHLTFRFWCPRQLPIYTLRRGETGGEDVKRMQCVRKW